MIKLNYRPEIDALRALAVIAVILYHAKVFLFGYLIFPGGFLGVDIFFVLSGYLISSLIYQELKNHNKINFRYFYERRIRRILPALIVVILVTTIFAWIYILPVSFVDYAKSIIYSLGFSSNFYFYFSGQEYGAQSGLLKPLLHTWSLSVEEQFYLVFPLFFLFSFRYLKKHIFLFFFLIALVSLIISEYLADYNQSLNYYLLISRIWEILCGAMLVFIEDWKKIRISNFFSNFFVFLGLVLIISSFFLIKTTQGHPSVNSLFPIIGTMIVIYFSKPKTFMNFFLSNKVFVGIGLISYSLYLWHYPFFSFYRIYVLDRGALHYPVIVFMIFLFSILTYYFIEKPFRDKNKIPLDKIIKLLTSIVGILLIASFIVIKKDGFKERFPKLDKFTLDNHHYINEARLKNIEIGIPNFTNEQKTKILIFGNSLGQDLFNSFILNKDLFSDYEFSIIYNQVHCLINIMKDKKLCGKEITSQSFKNLKKADIVLISTDYYPEDMKILDETIKYLKKINKKVIITTQHPLFYHKNEKSLLDEFYIKNKRLPNDKELLLIENNKFLSTNNVIIEQENKILKKIAIKNKIIILNKMDYLCDQNEKKCFTMTKDSDKIHLSTDHVTLSGAKFLGKRIYETNWLQLK